MNIHEYQAKELLRRYGVAVLEGHVAWTPEEAEAAAAKLPGPIYVVKSQIHAGGRGAGRFTNDPDGKGGVRLAKSVAEAKTAAAAMIGSTLVTKQTGPEGKLVSRVYVEAGCDIARELYLSLLVDRDCSRVVIMASTEGGIEIEEVAANHPEKILKVDVDPATGVSGYHGRKLAFGLGLEGKQVGSFVKFVDAMYKAFVELDCAIVEINPLVVTKVGDVVALDAKVSFDDSAMYRHKDLEALRDDSEMDPKELDAVNNDLNYVALDGEIGCMVNGAGLAMATMDIIKLYGSSPANFLDVGGTADSARVTEAFRIITSDANVKAILVNIFGGIAKCDMIATGIVEASKNLSLSVPLVVRLEGTNVELGKKILAESGLAIIAADNLADAAQKAVAAVKHSGSGSAAGGA
jgi:succinyl-CoA synthetase beta subunit